MTNVYLERRDITHAVFARLFGAVLRTRGSLDMSIKKDGLCEIFAHVILSAHNGCFSCIVSSVSIHRQMQIGPTN